jgi:hypothetical protein
METCGRVELASSSAQSFELDGDVSSDSPYDCFVLWKRAPVPNVQRLQGLQNRTGPLDEDKHPYN